MLQHIHEIRTGDHICCIYETPDEWKRVSRLFLTQGVQKGEKILCIAGPEKVDAFRSIVNEIVADEKIERPGIFSILTEKETFLKTGSFCQTSILEMLKKSIERMLGEGFSGLRILSEMSWLSHSSDIESLVELECEVNKYLPESKCLAMSLFDRNQFEPRFLLNVLRTHPIAVLGEEMHRNLYYVPPDEFFGEDKEESTLQRCVRNLRVRTEITSQLEKSLREKEYLLEEIRTLNLFLTAIRAVNQLIVREKNVEKLLQRTCELMVESKMFDCVWIQLAGGEKKHFQASGLSIPVDEAMVCQDNLDIPLSDDLCHTQKVENLLHISQMETGCQGCPMFARHRGKERLLAWLETSGKTFGILAACVSSSLRTTEQERALFAETAEDISFAMNVLENEALKKRMEEDFENLFIDSMDGILVLDQSGKVLLANKAAERFYGPGSQQISQMKMGFQEEDSEIEVTDSDGTTRIGQTRLSKITWAGRLATLVSIRDVTQSVRLERQLIQAQKMEAVGQLAGGVAHDFNNILQSMFAITVFLKDELDGNPEALRDVEDINKEAQRAATLTRQLLAFSRQQVLRQDLVNLNDLLEDLHAMLKRLLREDITLELELDPAIWLVKADPGQIEQVVMNLCINARDAVKPGGHIVIRTENYVGQASSQGSEIPFGQYAVISVWDNGEGISAEIQNKIFEPFFSTKESAGTGLGLSIVYGIVGQHGGHVSVSSSPGVGTEFRIYLPRTMEVDFEKESEGETGDTSGNETVLVAEDDESVRRLIVRMLDSAGYSTYVAPDGDEAIKILEEHSEEIDLAIVDMVMPKKGGQAVIQWIKDSKAPIRVLITTGYMSNLSDLDTYKDLGVGILLKPFDAKTLLYQVRGLLDADAQLADSGGGHL